MAPQDKDNTVFSKRQYGGTHLTYHKLAYTKSVISQACNTVLQIKALP